MFLDVLFCEVVYITSDWFPVGFRIHIYLVWFLLWVLGYTPAATRRSRYRSIHQSFIQFHAHLHIWSDIAFTHAHTHTYIGRTCSVPLLKPPQIPHCYLGAVDHTKIFPPPMATRQARSYRVNWATQTLLFSSPLILLRCVTEIKFSQNLRWLGNWH